MEWDREEIRAAGLASAASGDVNEVQQAIDAGLLSIGTLQEMYVEACKHGHINVLRFLDLNATIVDRDVVVRAAHAAVGYDQSDVLTYILHRYINYIAYEDHFESVLEVAVYSGTCEFGGHVEFMLRKNTPSRKKLEELISSARNASSIEALKKWLMLTYGIEKGDCRYVNLYIGESGDVELGSEYRKEVDAISEIAESVVRFSGLEEPKSMALGYAGSHCQYRGTLKIDMESLAIVNVTNSIGDAYWLFLKENGEDMAYHQHVDRQIDEYKEERYGV